MTELKREYVIPLRRKSRTAPKWRRGKKAISVLKDFIRKHMKTEDVIVCPELNEEIWGKGIRNPPGKVEVIVYRMQIGSDEKTIVNLKTIGVERYVEAYKAANAVTPSTEEELTSNKQETKEEKAEVKTEEKAEEPEKESEKKGAKKDE